jgi:hypothetical protein
MGGPATRDVIEEALTSAERYLARRRRPRSRTGHALSRVRPLWPGGDLLSGAVERLALASYDDEIRFTADAIRAEIVEEAEGNPLYLQELVRAAAEDGTERHRSWTLTALPAAGLPSSLESLLIARLDRLPINARWLAQSAAVLVKPSGCPARSDGQRRGVPREPADPPACEGSRDASRTLFDAFTHACC